MIADGLGEPMPLLSGELPPRIDPRYGDHPGPYSRSPLRGVTGTISNPDAKEDQIGWELQDPRTDLNYAHPGLRSDLEGIGGFDPRVRLKQPPAADWPLTGVITRIGLGAAGKVDLAPYPGTYIIDFLKLAPSFDGIPRHGWAMKIKEQLPEGSVLILSLFEYAHRAKSQGYWLIEDFWNLGFLAQFDAVLVPNVDAFSNSPIPQLFLGERLDQTFISEGYRKPEGQSAGINFLSYSPKTNEVPPTLEDTIIPSIAWGCQESSLRRQIELYASNPRVNTLCIDAHGPGLDKTLWTWRWLFALEKYAAPHTQIRWIISGITSGWAIRELNRIFPEGNYYLILSLSAYVHAKGASADPQLQAEHLRRAVNRLERLRTGQDLAIAKKRPERWPVFADCEPRQD